MKNAKVGYAIRAALLVAFAGYLYVVCYVPARHQPFDEPLTIATVRAFNAGLPFHLSLDAGNGSAPSVLKMTEYYGDYGLHILLSLVGLAARRVAPSFQLDASMARTVLLGFFVFAAAAILAPPVPLPAAVTGVVSLIVLFAWGPLGLFDARYWGVAFVAVVGMVYVATTLEPWTRSRFLVLVILAAFAAYDRLLRQEAGPATNIIGLALVGAALLVGLVSLRRGLDARAIAVRALAGGLLLITINALVLPWERWSFSRAWGTPYADTRVALHGSGWPLYLSLGYVSNPFNIGWRDPIGEIHARLIHPEIVMNADPLFQQTLLEEYERIVFDRPWLLVRNIIAKAARVHQLVGHRSGANTDSLITNPLPLAVLYWTAPWIALGALMLAARRGTAESVVLWFCCAATALGASVGAVLVFPDYIGGVQGAIVALALILPAAVVGSLTRESAGHENSIAGPLLRAFVAAVATVLVLGAAFIGVQWWRYRTVQADAEAGDPLQALETQGFRYAHVFNDLPIAKQGRLLAKLQASTDPAVTRVVDERAGDMTLFAPQLLVRTPTQIHVFVWMGRGFVPPTPRLFQGSTHASLLICGGCPPTATVNDVVRLSTARWTMINDLEWQGRYRMFSVQNSPMLDAVGFFRVTAERVQALDTSLPLWIVPKLIATARLAFPDR